MRNPDHFSGQIRTYEPIADDGDPQPPESQKVLLTVSGVISNASDFLTKYFDMAATKLWGNCVATADVVVNDTVLLGNVPIEYLLFLQRRLEEISHMLDTVPILNPAYDWRWDGATENHRTDPVVTIRNQKTYQNHVIAEATKEHPAQVQVYTIDIPAGRWNTERLSGAVRQETLNEWKNRVRVLQDAVRSAREDANSIDVTPVATGEKILDFIFHD